MSEEKPKDHTQVWTERELADKLGLPVTKHGRSIQLSNWIRSGLVYCERSGRRYFFEQDFIDFLWQRRNKTAEQR